MLNKKIFLIVLCLGIVVGFVSFRTSKGTNSPETQKVDIDLSQKFAETFLTPNPQPADQLTQNWKQIRNGVEIKGVPYQYNGATFQLQIVKIDPNQASLSLAYDKTGKTVGQWAREYSNAIVINSGFFKEKNEPVGLLYIDGERIDNHRVNPKNTGLLVLGQKFSQILNLANVAIPDEVELQNAVQTYPVLIDQGKVIASSSLTKQDRRTAIGLDADKNVYLITAPSAHLGLYDLAKTLHSSDIKFTTVLNLDGGGSTGIAFNLAEYQNLIDSQTLVPTVLVVEMKE